MNPFDALQWPVWRILLLIGIVIGSYFFTRFLFKRYIKFAGERNWIGRDIHKKSRPEVVESGGVAFVLGMIPGQILLMLIFSDIYREIMAFSLTVILSGVVGFIDDRKALSSIKKILLMIVTGIPLFLLNLDLSRFESWPTWLEGLSRIQIGFIQIDNPTIPFLGTTELNLIYQLAIPIILMVLTNGVNMLEGYNGEGSGTSLIIIVFMILYSLIARSSEGLILSLSVIGALIAFFQFNRFPAKVFPGDVGTLSLGAVIACIALLGSLEVAMFCAILVHIFNAFYVIASLRGFRERHTIKTQDIITTDHHLIEPSKGENDHLTLPRLILAEKPLTEPLLVRNIWALAFVGGLFGVIAETVRQSEWTPLEILQSATPIGPIPWWGIMITLIVAGILYSIIIIKYPAIRIITFFMIALLVMGVGLLVVLRVLIESIEAPWFEYVNWLIAGILAIGGFILWYYLSVRHLRNKISTLKQRNGQYSNNNNITTT
jgi:UDP-N-acetylglucosamine--dolichyl-phosphate N-acetylglucosaminephosphotransferase